MRKLLLLLGFCLSGIVAYGQVAHWIIRPHYDQMTIIQGTNLILTDSLGIYSSIWDFEGNRLFSTTGQLCPFSEGYAAVTDKQSGYIIGILSENGTYTPIQNAQYLGTTIPPKVFYSYLSVYEVGVGCRYLNMEGVSSSTVFLNAKPFMNGYASCRAYANQEKGKDPVNILLNSNLQPVVFINEGKPINAKDLEFVSSVNDSNVGVVIAQGRVYLFDGKTQALSPVYAHKEMKDKKSYARLYDPESLEHTFDGNDFVIVAKCGRAGNVVLKFDAMRCLTSIEYVDKTELFEPLEIVVPRCGSQLKLSTVDNLYGMKLEGGKGELPPQFIEKPTCFDDKAIVQLAGKYGLLKLSADEAFSLSMNKNVPIPFKHQFFETTVRLDMPSTVPAENVILEIDPTTGCEVDKPSGVGRNTQYGNYIEYNCRLQFPQVLADNGSAVLEYPAYVTYNGLKSPQIPFPVNVWHYKYITVNVNEEEKVLDNGSLTFTFNIDAQRDNNDPIYKLDVTARSDSLDVQTIQYSEVRYKCAIEKLAEGMNNVVIEVLEQGCPPLLFPYEIYYTKPVEKSKTTPAVEETVKIRKKEIKPAKEAEKPKEPVIPVVKM